MSLKLQEIVNKQRKFTILIHNVKLGKILRILYISLSFQYISERQLIIII